METIIFDVDNERFISQAANFCNSIDKYTEILGVNAAELDTLKCDVNLAMYISLNKLSLPPSMIRYSINDLRTRLADICLACRSSMEYTEEIGIKQGAPSISLERRYFADNWRALFEEILYVSPKAAA